MVNIQKQRPFRNVRKDLIWDTKCCRWIKIHGAERTAVRSAFSADRNKRDVFD